MGGHHVKFERRQLSGYATLTRQANALVRGGTGGADVLAAGQARFVYGELRFMNNDSGHYKPSGTSAETAAANAFSNATR